MNRTRTLTTAAVLTVAGLVACAAPAPVADPAQTTARPTIEQPDMSGPGRAAADEKLRDAVRGVAPWLLPR
jgi:hypothetical protein